MNAPFSSSSTPHFTDIAALADAVKALVLQKSSPPAFMKAVEEICVTCGGPHPYHQCLVTDGNIFLEYRDNIHGYVSADATSMSNQTNELKNMMASFFQMNTASSSGSGPLPSNTIAKPKGELKSITAQSGIVLDGPSVPMPPPFINSEEDERVGETLTDPKLAEYTIEVTSLCLKPQTLLDAKRDPLHPILLIL
ncbi:hypothetical protein Tco_0373936 [Tanacetum coccineum]